MKQVLHYEIQNSTYQANTAAQRLFDQAYNRGWLNKIGLALLGRSRRLLSLRVVEVGLTITGRHYLGLQTIPIDQIRGSEGRSNDFDRDFYPLQAHDAPRWKGLAIARQLGRALPPVELIQVDDIYFVRDGHHRISVAKMLGQKDIDAEVTVWQVAPGSATSKSANIELICQPI
jgi:hypothetical protein